MSNPFVSPDNPFGEWEAPFELVDGVPRADVAGITVDGVSITAAVSSNPLGVFPVLVLSFTSSALRADEQLPRLLFVSSERTLRAAARLFSKAADAACKAASKAGG